MEPVRIVLVDDHALFRNGLNGLISMRDGYHVIGEACNGQEFLDMLSMTSVDVVFMDPPRKGSDEAFLSTLIKTKPERVVYVSCGPKSLARDLKYLTKQGYRVKKVTPFDCFVKYKFN